MNEKRIPISSAHSLERGSVLDPQELKSLRGYEALERFISEGPEYVCDIGAGEGRHADIMRSRGIEVREVNLPENYLDTEGKYDGIWCCHVLEHQPDPHSFLKKIFNELEPRGLLAITVPPLKHNLVGGHLTLWNEGLLIYNLVLAGFDCSKAKIGVYGYNLSVIVRKKKAELPQLNMDKGDLELLSDFFPFDVQQGIDGRVGPIRW